MHLAVAIALSHQVWPRLFIEMARQAISSHANFTTVIIITNAGMKLIQTNCLLSNSFARCSLLGFHLIVDSLHRELECLGSGFPNLIARAAQFTCVYSW